MVDAGNTLRRSQEYFGALYYEMKSRYAELGGYSSEIALAIVKKHVIARMTRNMATITKNAAKAKANAAYGLWIWSLFLTYETITGLLEQHKDLQVAITSATLSDLLNDEVNLGRMSDSDVSRAIRWHCDYGFYSQIIQMTKGTMPWWHDLVDRIFYDRQYYKEVRLYYEDLLNRLLSGILALEYFDGSGVETTSRKDLPAEVIYYLDHKIDEYCSEPEDSEPDFGRIELNGDGCSEYIIWIVGCPNTRGRGTVYIFDGKKPGIIIGEHFGYEVSGPMFITIPNEGDKYVGYKRVSIGEGPSTVDLIFDAIKKEYYPVY